MKWQQTRFTRCIDPNAYYTNNFDKLNCGLQSKWHFPETICLDKSPRGLAGYMER